MDVPDLRMFTRADATGIVVELRGSLHDSTLEQLSRALVELLHEPAGQVVLDLHQLTDIGPLCLGTVIAGCDALHESGKVVRVRATAGTLHELRTGGIAEHCLSPAGESR